MTTTDQPAPRARTRSMVFIGIGALAVFLILSVVLIRAMGPLGAAIAIVASDLLVQFGLLGAIIIGQTLR